MVFLVCIIRTCAFTYSISFRLHLRWQKCETIMHNVTLKRNVHSLEMRFWHRRTDTPRRNANPDHWPFEPKINVSTVDTVSRICHVSSHSGQEFSFYHANIHTHTLWQSDRNNRVIFWDPWPFFSYLFFLDWFDNLNHFEEKLAPMYFSKMTANFSRARYSKWPPPPSQKKREIKDC